MNSYQLAQIVYPTLSESLSLIPMHAMSSSEILCPFSSVSQPEYILDPLHSPGCPSPHLGYPLYAEDQIFSATNPPPPKMKTQAREGSSNDSNNSKKKGDVDLGECITRLSNTTLLTFNQEKPSGTHVQSKGREASIHLKEAQSATIMIGNIGRE
jgi:hypothetical protein